MATRMQQRRGTAAQWTSANPVLNAAEMGWESDTNKFKIGDGVNHWADLDYFIDANSTVNPSFGTSIVFEGATADSFETTFAITDPTEDRTITFPDSTGTVQLRVTDVSDTEIGYLNGVTSGIQTQLDAKAPLADPTFTGTVSAASLTITGDLTVNGTTTNLNSTNLVIEDKNIVLGDTTTPTDTTADGGGITLKGATDKTFNWVDSTDSWTSSEHINLASGKTLKYNGTDLVASQTGNSGKYLTTDGTNTSWGTVSGYSAPTLGSTSIASGATVTTIAGLTLTSPTISTIINTGTLTLPTTTGTLALTSQIPVTASPTAAGLIHGFSSATSNSRTTLGYQAGNSLSGNNSNTAIGYTSLFSASTATDNTAVGHRAGYSVTASNNTIIGSSSGTSVSSDNTIVGAGSVWGGAASGWTAVGKGIAGNSASVSGADNVVIGNFGIFGATTATQNATLGTGAMQSSSTASYNLAAGYNAGGGLTTGANNTLLGYRAGKSGTNDLTTGSNNLLIGSNSAASSATVSNEIVIGNSSNTRLRIPGLNLDTDSATDGQVLGWNDSTGKFAWTTISGYSAPTIGSTSIASGATVTTIAGLTLGATSSSTLSVNTATTFDTLALASFTTAKYIISLKQGSKVRSSEVIMQTNGTLVDTTEFGLLETGGTIAGVLIAGVVSGSNALLQITVTDAATTNVTVKIQEVVM